MNISHATKKYGEPWWYFSRHDVHAELARAALSTDGLGNTPTLHLGNKVVHVDAKARSVTCSNGKVYTGDVIIGADGIHSASGKSVFGKLPVVGDGFSAYRCMIPTSKMRNNPETAILVDAAKVLIIVGPDRRIVAYPCSSWETMNFVCIFPDDRKLEHQWSTEVSVQEMVDMFKDFHPCVTTFLSMASNTGVWQLLDREPLSTLVNGPFAMIGDAAHAMGPHQGQGACQAIEDAEALRIILKEATPDQVEERLKIYDELRLKRVNQIIRHTRDMAPKRHPSQEVNHKTTQIYSNYHWGYKVTQDAVTLMNKHGYPMTVADVETAEVRFLKVESC
ncbi:salicylate hydroxylase [Penicillium sp. IBT 18751x]|nr:salicylate hydroxylase [Penicillium sp. IBT 18751x]